MIDRSYQVTDRSYHIHDKTNRLQILISVFSNTPNGINEMVILNIIHLFM